MSPPDNPRILQDTDWQTPAGEIVQILKDRLDDILKLCRVGSEDSVKGIIQDTATTYTSLKELEVQRSQILEQIRQHKETWAEAISSRQGERAEAENEDDSRRLSAAISALQQIFFDTDFAVNPTASAPESLAAIEPLEKAIRQQYQRLLDTKVRATDALTALNAKFEKQRDELNSTRRELGAATSENKRLTDELIRQDHNVWDLEAFKEMAQPIIAGEARLKEDERRWREEANRLSGKVENLNKELTIAQRDRAAFKARSERLQTSHDTLQNEAEDQAQLQQELANTQAQLAFKNKESDAEIRALNGKFKSLQSIASERLARLSTFTGVYEENNQLKESEVSLQSSLEAKSSELLAKSSQLIAVQQSLTSSRRSIHGLRESIRSFEGTLKTLEEDNSSLHKESRELKLQVSDLHRQIAEKLSATQALANQLRDREVSLVTAERAQIHLQSELDKLKYEQNDLEEEQKDYYRANSRLGTERDEQIAANKDLQDEIYDLRRQIRNINNRPSTVAGQFRRITNKSSVTCPELLSLSAIHSCMEVRPVDRQTLQLGSLRRTLQQSYRVSVASTRWLYQIRSHKRYPRAARIWRPVEHRQCCPV